MIYSHARAILLVLAVTATPAMADTATGPAGAARGSATPVKTLTFLESDDIEGVLPRPGGDLVHALITARRPSLIRHRTTFMPEIVRSAERLP